VFSVVTRDLTCVTAFGAAVRSLLPAAAAAAAAAAALKVRRVN